MAQNRFKMLREIEAARDTTQEIVEEGGDEQTALLAAAVLWLMPEPGES